MTTRTQVGIVGAGPAGLILAHLLQRVGIESVVLERRSRAHVEQRVRAGVLEPGTVEILKQAGVGAQVQREGLPHRGIWLRFGGASHRIDFEQLMGRSVTVYGQQEVVRDLVASALASGMPLEFDTRELTLQGLDTRRPTIRYLNRDGESRQLDCDFIAGCDGFHGICRPAIPPGVLKCHEHDYPFAWLGILARSRPVAEELIYTHHERGFALFSLRAPDVARYYLQCRPDEDLAQWSDERIWDELDRRLEGQDTPALGRGELLLKGITAMRSFVAEPMQYGRLFLAGDAAHIVPPTGAKGMNLAAADVRALSMALTEYYASGSDSRLQGYSQRCLRRVWKAQRFSGWMTSLLHRFDMQGEFACRVQRAELDYLTGSRAASMVLAENYLGLPFEDD